MGSRYEDTPNEARFQEITQRYGVSEVELQDFILAMIQEVKFLADCCRVAYCDLRSVYPTVPALPARLSAP